MIIIALAWQQYVLGTQGGARQPAFPDRPQRELRELTGYRTSLVRERHPEGTREANRLQKTLEGAHIKLAGVAADTMGKSGREMLRPWLPAQPMRWRWLSWPKGA